MQEYPCGYNKNNLAVVNIGGENGREKADWLRERLCVLPEVKDVAYANDLIGGSDAYMTEGADFGDGQVSMSMIYCSWNLPQVLGLELMEGRDFNEGEFGSILFTQDLKAHGAEMEVYADEFGDGAPIVGFIKNVNITFMRKADSLGNEPDDTVRGAVLRCHRQKPLQRRGAPAAGRVAVLPAGGTAVASGHLGPGADGRAVQADSDHLLRDCAAVVLYHYLKTARMNPAETLKNE